MYQKKVINQNVSEIFHFSTFTENPKTLFAYNFQKGHCFDFFQQIWNQCEILRFLIPISIFSKKFFCCCHISTFCKLSSQMRPKRLKITKNVFYKNVLESDLASIKGSGSFIFLKKFKIVSPYYATTSSLSCQTIEKILKREIFLNNLTLCPF